MLIAIPRETWPNEPRVAASPETVKKLIALGYSIAVESGAGAGSYFSDQAFADAGADIRTSPSTLYADAHLILKVRRPAEEEVSLMKRGAVVVAILAPFGAGDALQAYATAGLTTFSMDLMPRITRAQSMDVLSSQSNLAGYKAVIDASAEYGRALPMMMTAAGTVAPAKTFVMGAGVAGLQAIATAKRLGSVVSATDVRPAVKEQVESLGGSFIMVDSEEAKDAETSGGYAKEMSEDFKRAQASLVAEHIAKQDIVICTALIPGRPAPTLVTEEMVRTMKPGAIIVDLAVEQGGNCPLSRVGEIVDVDGVK
ncbi:MAG: NAD(P) transhydrogenase subunit alpha, partial [Pseudomonadota bacterium]